LALLVLLLLLVMTVQQLAGALRRWLCVLLAAS
jgi:hypothetical protein